MGTRTLQAALSIALLVWMAVPAAAAAAKAAARGLPEGFLARVLSTPAERAAAFDELMTVGRLQELASVPKNLVQAYVFGTIDTPAVIGGLDGWLFYREQFRDSACPPDPVPYVTAANSVATAQALAELVGVHLVWAMAPDKSVVHPEKLGPRVVAEAPCRLATATLFRETLRRLAPQVVDHLEALSREPDGPQYYWATDTHWNRVGYLRAMWQLRQALDGTTGTLEIVADEAASEVRTTDLPRLAVGRNATEAGPAAPTEVEKLVLGTPIGGTQGAVVVHDSFLGVYTESATLFGPEAVVVNVNRLDVEELPSVIDGLPGLILLSTAERQAVRRMTGDWAIDGPLMSPVKDAYLAESRRACGAAPQTAVADAPLVTVPTGGTAHLVEVAEGVDCLRLGLATSEAGGWRVWLPPLAGQFAEAEFEPGRSFTLEAEQEGDAPLLLPEGVQGRALLIEPLSVAAHGGAAATLDPED